MSRPRFEAENSRIEARSFDGWAKLLSPNFVANCRVTSSLSSSATRFGCHWSAPDCKCYSVVPRNKGTSRSWADLLRVKRRYAESCCLRGGSCRVCRVSKLFLLWVTVAPRRPRTRGERGEIESNQNVRALDVCFQRSFHDFLTRNVHSSFFKGILLFLNHLTRQEQAGCVPSLAAILKCSVQKNLSTFRFRL